MPSNPITVTRFSVSIYFREPVGLRCHFSSVNANALHKCGKRCIIQNMKSFNLKLLAIAVPAIMLALLTFIPIKSAHAQYYGYGWYDETTGIAHIFNNAYGNTYVNSGCGNGCGGNNYNYNYNNYSYGNSNSGCCNYGYQYNNSCCGAYQYHVTYNHVQPTVSYSYPSYSYSGCGGGCGGYNGGYSYGNYGGNYYGGGYSYGGYGGGYGYGNGGYYGHR